MTMGTTVILRGPETWNRWIALIRLQAQAAEIWELIDPSQVHDKAVPFPPLKPPRP